MTEPVKTKYGCPDCGRPILNRKFNKCLYCGATLAKELLYTDNEIQEKEARYNKQMLENERQGYRNTISSKPSFGSDFGNFIDIADFDDSD